MDPTCTPAAWSWTHRAQPAACPWTATTRDWRRGSTPYSTRTGAAWAPQSSPAATDAGPLPTTPPPRTPCDMQAVTVEHQPHLQADSVRRPGAKLQGLPVSIAAPCWFTHHGGLAAHKMQPRSVPKTWAAVDNGFSRARGFTGRAQAAPPRWPRGGRSYQQVKSVQWALGRGDRKDRPGCESAKSSVVQKREGGKRSKGGLPAWEK